MSELNHRLLSCQSQDSRRHSAVVSRHNSHVIYRLLRACCVCLRTVSRSEVFGLLMDSPVDGLNASDLKLRGGLIAEKWRLAAKFTRAGSFACICDAAIATFLHIFAC